MRKSGTGNSGTQRVLKLCCLTVPYLCTCVPFLAQGKLRTSDMLGKYAATELHLYLSFFPSRQDLKAWVPGRWGVLYWGGKLLEKKRNATWARCVKPHRDSGIRCWCWVVVRNRGQEESGLQKAGSKVSRIDRGGQRMRTSPQAWAEQKPENCLPQPAGPVQRLRDLYLR